MDRFFRGLLFGVTGGVLINLWGFFTKDLLHFATKNYTNWTSVVIMGFLLQQRPIHTGGSLPP